MRRFFVIGCGGLLGLVAVGLLLLALANWREYARRDHPLEAPRLSGAEERQVGEALRLKGVAGDELWPGFGAAAIPIVLYNDRYEFGVGLTASRPGWEQVPGDTLQRQPYHRRRSRDPQAFAVEVGGEWAGSIPALERMNRDYLKTVRTQMPPVLAQLFPYPFATLGEDFYVVTILHEVFHAWQARRAPERFARWRSAYAAEKRFPYSDEGFAEAWDQEGAALSEALEAPTPEAARGAARRFLRLRSGRRSRAALDAEALRFERELEWLEGLAKYTEIKAYERASSRRREPAFAGYRPDLGYWKMEFDRLRSSLGRQHGDFRFYLSGMAQARLLDRLSPGWKRAALRDGVYLEDLLHAAVSAHGLQRPTERT